MLTLFNRKKRHFLGKRFDVERNIWNLEFKLFSCRELREAIRLDRDKHAERADALKLELQKEHKDETKQALEKELALSTENVKRYEAQMKMLDEEITGAPYVSPEEPGRQGINDNLGALAESRKMIEAYYKTL